MDYFKTDYQLKMFQCKLRKWNFFLGEKLNIVKICTNWVYEIYFPKMFEIQLCRRKINFLKLTLNVEDTCYNVMLNMIL